MSGYELHRLRSRDEITEVGKAVVDEIKTDDVPSLAAAVAFKIVLALFPSLVAAIGIFGVVTEPTELENLLNSLGTVVPSGAVDFLRSPLHRLINERAAGGIAAIVGVAIGLWAATGAATTLNKSLSRAYDLTDERKLVKARTAALVVTVALLLALIGMFVLLVAGGRIENSLLASLPLTDTARGAIDLVVTILRYLLAAVALMVLFAFIYWVGPDYEHRPRYVWITPGAVLGVVTWLVASGLFGLYASVSGNFSGSGSIYGSLGNAILFMIWLQLSMLALLLGAEVNQVLQLRAHTRTSTAQMAGLGAEPASRPASGAARGGKPGAHITLSDDPTATGDGAPAPRTPYPSGPRGSHPTVHGRAVDVQDHQVPPPDDRGGTRRMRIETIVGAAVAAASSVAGLAGLLRRRRGG